MNIFYTVVAGTFIFVLSQYFLKIILEPVIQCRKILSDISHTLLYYQGEILGGNSGNIDMHNKIADLSAQLRSSVYLIPFYTILFKVFALPKRENILLACRKLNTLSYPLQLPDEEPRVIEKRFEGTLKAISKLLTIETTYMLDEESNPK